MRSTLKRLHSQKGSSLIISIVFFMLCFFVGGAVLAAATANGGRIANLKSDRKAYYLQRSAAMELQDQLSLAGSEKLKLEIDQITNTVRTTTVSGGTTVSESSNYELNLSGNADRTPLQQSLMLAAANVYWDKVLDTSIKATTSVTGLATSDADFTANPGTMEFAFTDSVTGITYTLSATYSCSYEDSTHFGSFEFRFLGPNAADDTQIILTMHASISSQNAVSGVRTEVSGNTRQDFRTTTQKIFVTWSDPVIQKGGAES